MNDVLKQRLVGALVIIALAVLLWPLIFVEPSREAIDRTSQVPRMPQIETVELQEPTPIQGLPPAVLDEEVALHEAPPQAVDDFEEEPGDPPGHGLQAIAEFAETSSNGQPASTTGSAEVVEDSEQVPGEAPKPALDDRGIPIAWSLQVVSVSNRERADELVDQLVAMGHKAYLKPVNRDGGRLYTVFVGPMFELSRVSALKPVIDDALKVNSIVARYVP